jgi:hypothetical protein
MTLAEFLNAAKILRRLDRDELIEGQVLGADDVRAWLAFRSNPLGWLQAYASDSEAAALWALVEARMPALLPAGAR